MPPRPATQVPADSQPHRDLALVGLAPQVKKQTLGEADTEVTW